MRNKWDFFFVSLVLLVGVYGIYGLWLLPGLPTSHDSISHLARLFAYQEGLGDGIFPVLWAKRLYFGIGSPSLMLNYQIPYYFTMLWNLVGMNLDNSFKATLSFSYVVSGFLMYRSLRLRYDPLPSFCGAFLYLVVPYRFLNIYVRGALGEVFSNLFPPIILYGIWQKSRVVTSLGFAGLFLSHPVGSALYSAVFLGYMVFVEKITRFKALIKVFFVPYLIAVLVASFNLIPTLALTKYTYYKTENSNTIKHFPSFAQLVYSKWGYGFSSEDQRDEMSFQVGIVQWLLGIWTIVYLCKKSNNETQRELRYLLVMATVAIGLMIEWLAKPIYLHLKIGKIIDFPWRMLMVLPFVGAIGAPILLKTIRNQKTKLLVVAMIVALASYSNRNHIRINAIWPWPSTLFRQETGDAFGEYSAMWRETMRGSEFRQQAQIIKGRGRVKLLSDRSNRTMVEVETDESATLRFNTMYFPGWQAKVNGVSHPIKETKQREPSGDSCYITGSGVEEIDESGLIACPVQPGNSIVEIQYKSLPIHKLANTLSIIGLVSLIYLARRPVSNISKIPTKRPRS